MCECESVILKGWREYEKTDRLKFFKERQCVEQKRLLNFCTKHGNFHTINFNLTKSKTCDEIPVQV